MTPMTMNRRLATWLVPVLIIASLPVAQTDSAKISKDICLCVEAPKPLLEAMGLQVDDVYDSFVTILASQEDERALERAGVAFFRLEGRDDVVLPGASFVLSREDYDDKGLGAFRDEGIGQSSGDGSGAVPDGAGSGQMYVVVKLKGPEKTGWLEALEAAGARKVGGPLSHYNMIVRMDEQRLKDVSRLGFVRWM
jgi:hypothetical protein